MSKIEVNAVEPQCGTTLTLGASGDTVTLGSGASQSGFGRTGTVDWQTGSIKTSNFTATNGEGYFVNTTSGAVTMSLPAGSAGAIVSIQDYNNTFDSNALTIDPNGSEKINGGAGALVLTTEGQGLTLVYIDSTVGWRSIHSDDFATIGSDFIVGSGGTETTCGDFKIHTFTGPGTFTVTAVAASPSDNNLEYLVVAGGGGGGGQSGNTRGGAGAGGFRFAAPSLAPLTYPAKPLAAPAALSASVQAYPITVGSGGAGSCSGTQGADSIFSTITSAGGGRASAAGGSGGGHPGGSIDSPGPAGNTPPVSPAQGRPGGNSSQIQPDHGSGGGGGAMADGSDGRGPACTGRSGPGGAGGGLPAGFGANGQPCGSFRYYAGGGGGGGSPPVSLNAGVGGLGGGASGSSSTGSNATANTGGGGGSGGPGSCGGNGGSGIVVIRYKYQ